VTFVELLLSGSRTLAGLVAIMAVLAVLEAAVPRRRRGAWNRAHLGPNLGLTAITFATNLFLNAGLVLVLALVEQAGYRPLAFLGLGSVATAIAVVVALDFAWYLAHTTMHRVPRLWRIHAVHHSDPAIDVTTTIRQHPAEGLIRYAYMGVAAVAIGAPPAAFAVYRVWSALQGLVSHSNVRLPARLEAVLGLVFVTPRLHELHHSVDVRETNTNYGTITNLFDRLFRTFTPARRGGAVAVGLLGHDEPASQTLGALLRAREPAGPHLEARTCAPT
jgi:sterol desaturase/sphingolipid hydroxylase (fatty acid hydroxylase superfamily)